MKKELIIRAWKDPAFRASLSADERASLPESPSGRALSELDESELNDDPWRPAGGVGPRHGLHRSRPRDVRNHQLHHHRGTLTGSPLPQVPYMQVIAPVFPWKKATFLHERATAKGGDSPSGKEPAHEEAERQMSAWRQLMAGDDATLDERLRSVGLDREDFLRILLRAESAGEGPEDSGSWVSLIEEVIEQRHAGEPRLPPSLQPPSAPGKPGQPFSGFLHPFVRIAAARLRTVVAAMQARYGLEQALLTPEAEATLLESLARRLQFLSTRTLILELNVARVMDQLPGDTPQERFHYFCTTHFQEPR